MDIENILNKILEMDVDEAALMLVDREKRQVRFSNNRIDVSKLWLRKDLQVFLAKGKRIFYTSISDMGRVMDEIEKYVRLLNHLPENEDFRGLNPEKQSYRKPRIEEELLSIDLENLAMEVIEGSLEKGATRAAGVVYRDHVKREIITNYNRASDEVASIDVVVRAFNQHGTPGQESITTSSSEDLEFPREIGERAGSIATMGGIPEDGREGKFDILFHPLAFGSLVSYSMHMASAFAVDAGMSFFSGKIGERAFSKELTLYDDPSFFSAGHRIFDEEATATGKTTIIENGVLKTYLHSYSTAQKFGTKTTGNAGILEPRAWQPVMEPGNKGFQDILSEMKEGLYIVNLWYTRFQDYRNGDFSTIPRDGIFYVRDGEIVGSWKGIRITENMVRMFSSIVDVSREREKVKWWDEVLPSYLPYVMVEGVNVTRSTL